MLHHPAEAERRADQAVGRTRQDARTALGGLNPDVAQTTKGVARLSVPYDDVVRMIRTFAATIAENKEYLTELDSAIGDADHGINMDRGFQAVLVKLDALPPGDVGSLFKTVGMTLVSTVGGAGGPLYGTLFLQLGTATAGKTEIDAQDWAAALAAAVQGVQARGKAELAGQDDGRRARACARRVRRGARARERRSPTRSGARPPPARTGMKGTIPLVARKGTGELPGRAERRTPRPRCHVVVPVAEDGRGDVERGIAHDRTVTMAATRPRMHGRRPHMADYVGALDQGTTSTRFMIFDHSGGVVGVDQKEHEQIFPKPGWVEHDPKEIWAAVAGGDRRRAEEGRHRGERPRRGRHHEPARDDGRLGPQHGRARLQRARVAGHAQQDIVDSLSADGDQDRFREKTGLPLATYFSGHQGRAGSSTTSTALARGPRPATSCSATSTPGASGTSRAEPTAARTSPT